MIKIALIGYGKMGQKIHELAQKDSTIEITATLDQVDEINEESLQGAQIAIDFTHPTQALPNLKTLAELKTNVVMGTTGWYDQIDEAKQIVDQNKIGFLYASNFSIGVHLFWKTLEQAAKNFAKFDQYDVFGHEFHHTEKADSPSGTAVTTAVKLLENLPGKKRISYETEHGKIQPDTLHFTSTRGGKIPGTHSIFFDSEADTIEITHTARNRDGFASGALTCAKWLSSKTGFFTIDDYLNEIL